MRKLKITNLYKHKHLKQLYKLYHTDIENYTIRQIISYKCRKLHFWYDLYNCKNENMS